MEPDQSRRIYKNKKDDSKIGSSKRERVECWKI
jgi:hypothetical protein